MTSTAQGQRDLTLTLAALAALLAWDASGWDLPAARAFGNLHGFAWRARRRRRPTRARSALPEPHVLVGLVVLDDLRCRCRLVAATHPAHSLRHLKDRHALPG